MIINFISLLGIVMTVFLIKYLGKDSSKMKYVKIISWILLIYKLFQYTYLSITEGFTFPVEISTITYFLFTIIVVIGKEKYYHIASFFGILSGFGYFTYYSIFGYLATFHLGMYDLVIAIFSHGILFAGGVYLSKITPFKRAKQYQIFLVLFFILIHAALFYADKTEGTTFIYNIVKPTFLDITNSDFLNLGVKLLFYGAWISFILICTKIFYKMNQKYHQEDIQALS